jgi:hypothetical protein
MYEMDMIHVSYEFLQNQHKLEQVSYKIWKIHISSILDPRKIHTTYFTKKNRNFTEESQIQRHLNKKTNKIIQNKIYVKFGFSPP